MPFLVDSVTMERNRQGHARHCILHPIYGVKREADGRLTAIAPRDDAPDAPRESWMYVEVDRLVDAQQRAQLAAGIERVLADVRAAVTDWRAMLAKLQAVAEPLQHPP